MTKLFTGFALTLVLYSNIASATSSNYNSIWRQSAGVVPTTGMQQLHPDKYVVFALNEAALKQQLASVSSDPNAATTIDFPMPDGSFRSFKVWEYANMEPALAAKYPEIKTYTAVAADNKRVTAKLDFTVWGFHAMIYDGDNTYLVDPYSDKRDGYYICYYKHDYKRPAGKTIQCNVEDPTENELQKDKIELNENEPPALKINGTLKHTYRLALACTGEYAVAVSGTSTPTKSGVLSAMTTSMNRINGVFERELSMHMSLVGNNDQVIFLDGNTDPFDNSSGTKLQTQNQTTCDNNIGTLAYDIGHVFSTWSSGGISELGCVCKVLNKAMSTSGQSKPYGDAFDIDFAIHEMGHQFGAYHTFNSNSCGSSNVAAARAYEPGSGSTIMAYAKICSVSDNVQYYSDDYFHMKSLMEISDFMVSPTGGGVCGSTAANPNTPPQVSFVGNTYFIPYKTPFELTAPDAQDTDHDSMTYCWEQWDLGDVGKGFWDVHQNGPLVRSFRGTASTTRVFPTLDSIRHNHNDYLGERLPDVERIMKFRYTVRDMLNGWGCFNISDDSIFLNVVNTGIPFFVKWPNSWQDYWQTGSTVTVTWEVAQTDKSPINDTDVDIFLSLDDGRTYPITLATKVPNTGSAQVVVPNTPSGDARVKVKGNNNVFFDISNEPFSINSWPAGINATMHDAAFHIYPVPAKDVLHITMDNSNIYSLTITNTLGQVVLQTEASKQLQLNVAGWATGMYNVKFTDKATGSTLVKKFTVE